MELAGANVTDADLEDMLEKGEGAQLLGGHIQIVATLGLLLLVTKAQNQNPNVTPVHKRFEYKYSFKPPYLAQKDGTVPFFEYSGSKYIS